MNDPVRLHQSTIEDDAALWLIRRDNGLSEEDEAELAHWLAASSSHQAAWQRASALWHEIDATPDPILDAMRQEALRARPEKQWLLGAVAATILFLAIGAAVAGLLHRSPAASVEIAMDAPPQYSTASNERKTIALADGTRVTMDANTALTAAYLPRHRNVRLLKGQAFFEVAHDATRPFCVQAADRRATDTGTTFSVSIEQTGMSAILASGRIDIARAGSTNAITMRPGQKYVALPGGSALVSVVDLNAAFAWRSGYLEFQDVPLSEALAQVNRYAIAPVRIGDTKTASLRISGHFRAGDAQGFLQTVQEIYPLKVQHTATGALVLRAN